MATGPASATLPESVGIRSQAVPFGEVERWELHHLADDFSRHRPVRRAPRQLAAVLGRVGGYRYYVPVGIALAVHFVGQYGAWLLRL